MPWTGWPRIPVQPGRSRTDRQTCGGCGPAADLPADTNPWHQYRAGLARAVLARAGRLAAGQVLPRADTAVPLERDAQRVRAGVPDLAGDGTERSLGFAQQVGGERDAPAGVLGLFGRN